MSNLEEGSPRTELNNNVINKLRDNNPKVKSLVITKPAAGAVMVQKDSDDLQYIIQGSRDKGLVSLGLAIGKNKHLSRLVLDGYGLERFVHIESFFPKLSHNTSICLIELYSFRGIHINVISQLSPFFYGNRNLTQLKISDCTLGTEGCRLLALAISTHISSLTCFCIVNRTINQGHSDEDLAVIVQALKVRPQQLQELHIRDNIGSRTLGALESLLHYTTDLRYLGLNGSVVNEVVNDYMAAVLAAAMNCKLLHSLNLNQCNSNGEIMNGGIDIGEEGIDVLASALPNNNLLRLDLGGINGGSVERLKALVIALPRSLVTLNLSNISIGESEVKALAGVLKADPPLETLGLNSCGIREKGIVMLAEALANNSRLRIVQLSNNDVITSEGWQAFSNSLCDTSTVNKTYLSNHMIEKIRLHPSRGSQDVTSALELNRCDDKGLVAKKKILKHHRHFDIQPFVQWNFKVLLLLIGWLESVAPFSAEFDMNGTVEMRKLTVVYEFVQSLPELFVLTYSLQELNLLRYEQSRRRMYQMQADPDLDSRIVQVEHRLAML